MIDKIIYNVLYYHYYIKAKISIFITKIFFNYTFILSNIIKFFIILINISSTLGNYILILLNVANFISLPFDNKIQVLNKDNLYRMNKDTNKINNKCILHLHGGAGIFQFPVSYTDYLFSEYKSNFDLYYLSYELAQSINEKITIITSCASNVFTIMNSKNYDEYIFFADSMGAPIIYYTLVFLYNGNENIKKMINNSKITLHFISPYVYYKDIKTPNIVDYIPHGAHEKLIQQPYGINVPFFNSSINTDLNINEIIDKKFINLFNIKIYYSKNEMLGSHIEKFCSDYSIESYATSNTTHGGFFYKKQFVYDYNKNVIVFT
jgi:hypothetical protein